MEASSVERNLTLIKEAQAGDKTAMDELITGNMGLVKSIALRFRDRGVEYEDLVQLGTIGMIKAVRSFDFSYQTAFSTYAVPLIIGEIRRFLRDDGLIKVSRSIKRDGGQILRKKEEFMREHHREPTVSELSALCDLPVEELVYILEAVSPIHSLQEAVGGDDDGMTLGGLLCDKENAIEALTDRLALQEAIRKLPPIQRRILTLRYQKELSQQQTGDILGLTQVKVSREEKKIMAYLRSALGTG